MFVDRADSTFEIGICAVDGEWEGKIIEHNIVRMLPTLHLQHRWTSQAAAIAGVQRRWRRLFPDETDDCMPDVAAAVSAAPEALSGSDSPTETPGIFSYHSMRSL